MQTKENNQLRTRIILEARSWIGTPFHLQGRLKNIGVDCIGLVIGVATNLGLKNTNGMDLASIDECSYDMHSCARKLIAKLDQNFVVSRTIEKACVALFSRKNMKHLAIIGDYDTNSFSIIHSCMKNEKVIEHRLTQEIKNKIFKIYKFKE